MDKPKEKPTVLVTASPDGFRWKVIIAGETVGTGAGKTEFEARNAANEFAARAKQEPTEGP